MKKADKKVCVCGTKENVVFIDTVEGIGTEFDILVGFYCTKCNSFWREP